MPSEVLTHYYKLPYIGPFPIPKELLSNVIYTFICFFFYFFIFINTKTFIDNHKTKYKVQGRPTLKKTQKHYRKQQLQNTLQNAYLQTKKRCLQQLSRLLDIKIP